MNANFNNTLQGKVVYVVLLTCFVSLLVTSAAFVSYEWYALKKTQESELAHISELLGEQLHFGFSSDKKILAQRELAILKVLPDIESAYLFSDKQTLFAYYRRADAQHAVPANLKAAKEGLERGSSFVQSIPVRGKGQGTLVLVSDLDPVQEVMKGFALKAIITMLLAMFIAFLLGDRLKRTITTPINALTRATRKIAESQAYHLRVQMVDIEELGQLIDSFNHMLSVISTRSEEIENVKNYLYEMIDALSSVLVGIDGHFNVVYFNEAGCALANLPLEEIIGENLFTVLPFIGFQEQIVRRAISEQDIIQSERFVIDIEGQPHTYVLTAHPLEHQTGAVLLMQDVSQDVEMEARVIQNEKMMSLGGMAAGMAHEINNPLGGVMQGAQNVDRRLDLSLPVNMVHAEKLGLDPKAFEQYLQDRQIRHFLTGIRKMGERMAAIIRTMLQFARGSNTPQSLVSPHQLVQSALEIARSNRHLSNVTINMYMNESLPALKCNPTEIQQVLVNIILNAAQAMHDQQEPLPTIRITTKHVQNDIVFEIEDNGPGIPEEIQNKVFEPFFTTKTDTTGTGLGMSLSYFIISTRHSGHMKLANSSKRGTCFQIILPISGLSESASS